MKDRIIALVNQAIDLLKGFADVEILSQIIDMVKGILNAG